MEDTMNITVEDVAAISAEDIAPDPIELLPTTLSLKELRVGMPVVFADHRLNTHPACHVSVPHESNADALAGRLALVVAVEPTRTGKVVALAFKQKVEFGHSCDGRVPHGHGAYALPEHLYTLDAYKRHVEMTKKVQEEQERIDTLLQDFIVP